MGRGEGNQVLARAQFVGNVSDSSVGDGDDHHDGDDLNDASYYDSDDDDDDDDGDNDNYKNDCDVRFFWGFIF